MTLYFRLAIVLFLTILPLCQHSFARGCNKPQRICTLKEGKEYCYWKDDTSCRHCSRKKCNANVGCRWSGFLIKKCASDFSTGSDEPA